MKKNQDMIHILAISGLLHDIGKFIRRSAESQLSHQDSSEKFLDDNKKFLNILSNDEFNLVKKLVKYHHVPFGEINKLTDLDNTEKDMLRILIYSDWDSASERVDGSKNKFTASAEYSPIHNILSVINFAFEADETTNEDELSKMISEIPIFEPNSAFEYKKPVVGINTVTNQNKNAYIKFKEEFVELCKKSDNKYVFIVGLNYLLKKYTTFTTSSGKETIKDISLYHHSFTTAAFAVCRYIDYLSEGNISKNREIGAIYGRLFKIQEYIFNGINSKIEKPMRRILTRSQLISILNMLIPYDIIKTLKLYPFNIIFYGGGSFLIFLPTTYIDSAKQRIEEINKLVINYFEGKIYFETVYDTISIFSNNDINNQEYNIGNELKRLSLNLANKKYQRTRATIYSYIDLEYYNRNFVKCDNCKINAIFNEGKIKDNFMCNACKLENKWMEIDDISDILFDFEKLYVDYIKDPLLIKSTEQAKISLNFSNDISQNIVADTFLQGRSIIRPKEVCNNCSKLHECKENYKNSEKAVISLNCLENLSQYDNIVATAKMDIDDLGFILYNVYPFTLKSNKEGKYPFSVSRLSYSSWVINLFFTQGIKDLIKKKYGNSVIILYSGGDDLLLTGVWDKVIEVIKDIEIEFSQLILGKDKVMQNRDVTVTSSIVFHRSNENFDSVITSVSEGLEKAKSLKNRVFIFDEVIKYPELRDALEYSNVLFEYVQNKYFKKADIYKLLKILDLRKDGILKNNQYKIIKAASYYNYFISRHIENNTSLSEKTKKELVDFLDNLMISHFSFNNKDSQQYEFNYNSKGIVSIKIALRKLIKVEE
ncbi:type III-A CRISPR-associated protein Cas10/Csm1 [Caldicellulosiruptoraceae bacterium PP1]